jgi:hypothetical protein
MSRMRLLLVLTLLSPLAVLAQAEPAPAQKAAKLKCDPATVVTVKGTVLGETRVDRGKGHKSVHLVVKVGDEQVSVHLGPDSWVDRQSVKFTRGDEVSVKGSKFTYNGKMGLIAQVVVRGGETLAPRDAAGKPAWAASAGK